MSLKALIATGTKVWLDGVEPGDLQKNHTWGATGATSNPIIISDIIKKGKLDDRIKELIGRGMDDDAIAWALDDELVTAAQRLFLPDWAKTQGDDGYVSFELDPLIEDDSRGLSHDERVRRYGELGQQWARGHKNRMIKVPATAAGLDALEGLAAAGVTINVTLMFSERQCQRAREAIWRGAQRRADGLKDFKSVYSIFISRIDVFTKKEIPQLLPASQGQVGLVIAKRAWRSNQEFWKDKGLRLKQEIVFASTGVKEPSEAKDKYVEALAGSDIQTNPEATNDYVQGSDRAYARKVDQLPSEAVLKDIGEKVDMAHLEEVLLSEGKQKFIDPQVALQKLIAEKRAAAK